MQHETFCTAIVSTSGLTLMPSENVRDVVLALAVGVYAAKASPTRGADAHLKADSTTLPGERFRTTV